MAPRRLLALVALTCFPAIASAQRGPDAAPGQENPGRVDREPVVAGTGANVMARTTSMEVLNDSAKLGYGDRVSFRVVEERREPIPLFVTDSGEMEVPYIGRVQALGKTCKQTAYEIKRLLVEKGYFKRATVILGLDTISVKSRGKIYITGQVRNQGVLEIPPDDPLTVSRAVLRVGGLADFADKRKVKLVRQKAGAKERVPDARQARSAPQQTKKAWWWSRPEVVDHTTEVIYVDLEEILERGHLEKDPLLKAGDMIIVPARLFNF